MLFKKKREITVKIYDSGPQRLGKSKMPTSVFIFTDPNKLDSFVRSKKGVYFLFVNDKKEEISKGEALRYLRKK